MNNKLQYRIEINCVKLFYKINNNFEMFCQKNVKNVAKCLLLIELRKKLKEDENYITQFYSGY